MAVQVAGDMYYDIDGQLAEIKRQLRQLNGYPFSPEALKEHLQDAIEGRMGSAVQTKKLLELVTTVSIGKTKPFVAAAHFKVDTKETGVRIAWLGGNFKERFLKKVEGEGEAVVLKVSKLPESSLNASIMKELGDAKITTLGQMWEMLGKQGKGEDGPLLTNGWANIFYITDADSALWAVDAYWLADVGGWDVEAYSVGCPDRWDDGSRVVSS